MSTMVYQLAGNSIVCILMASLYHYDKKIHLKWHHLPGPKVFAEYVKLTKSIIIALLFRHTDALTWSLLLLLRHVQLDIYQCQTITSDDRYKVIKLYDDEIKRFSSLQIILQFVLSFKLDFVFALIGLLSRVNLQMSDCVRTKWQLGRYSIRSSNQT